MIFVWRLGMDKQSFVKLRINRMMLITFVIAMVTVFGWIDPVQCAADIGFAKNVTNRSTENLCQRRFGQVTDFFITRESEPV